MTPRLAKAAPAESLVELNARLERDMEAMSREILEKYEEVNVLYRLSDSFRDMFDERQILGKLLTESARSVRARSGWLSVLAPEGALTARIRYGERRGEAPDREDLESELATRSIAENRVLSLERGREPGESTCPIMAAPLPGKAGPLGALVLEKPPAEDAFLSGEIRLVSAIAAFGANVVENRRLALEMKEAERVRGDIELARRIQMGLLPSADPEVPGLQVSGICRPARDIGGDYFGYTRVAPGRFGVTIADVSGHGLGAAIGMVVVRCLIQSEAHQSVSPARIATRVNELLHRDLTADPGMFVTAFLAVYEEETGRFLYTNAGHNPPLLFRSDGGRIEGLPGGYLGLGIEADVAYADHEGILHSGDLLVFYTDGVTEARSQGGEMFGQARLKRLVTSCRTQSAREAVEAIVDGLGAWRGQSDFDDDVTLVVARKE